MTTLQIRPFQIRPFEEGDRDAIVETRNRDQPPHRRNTVTAWVRRDSLRKPELVDIRLCAVISMTGQVAGFLDATDLSTTTFKMEDVCDFGIMVDHAYRQQGIGAALYDRAAAFAEERRAKRLVTQFVEWTPGEPGIAFLEKRGFAEMERESPSCLDLTQWSEAPFLGSSDQAAAYGVQLFSYDSVEDTEDNRRRLYELDRALIYDIPRRDTQPFTVEPFEDFVKSVIERPEWRPDLHVIAAKDGEWIGKCHVVPKLEFPTVGMQWLTGVLKAHRGHGVATALKVAAYRHARAAGVLVMTTENNADNAPMLAINRKFGFAPEPSVVVYNRVLRE